MPKPKKARTPRSSDSVTAHYDASASRYHEQYERDSLSDPSTDYPANYFRLQLLLNSFLHKGVKRVIEVGVGDATPLIALGDAGFDVWGFDNAKNMVRTAKRNMRRAGYDPSRIFWGDIQDPITYVSAVRGGPFDGLMAMGVMPHVANDDAVVENIGTLVRPGGSIFVEFRNKLFSLFTFNRHTADFILDDLLHGVDPEMKKRVAAELNERLRMEVPPAARDAGRGRAPRCDEIFSKFHNPFEVQKLLERHRFGNITFRWYHYHPAMPYLCDCDPQLFRNEAIKLERESSGWRGMFLCSAFVAEATKRA